MKWHPDVPDLPIEKPEALESLEKADAHFLDSMPGVEIDEKIDEVSEAVARAYKKQSSDSNYDECVEVVSIALNVTGSAIGGKMGTAMVARNENAAKTACRIVFSERATL